MGTRGSKRLVPCRTTLSGVSRLLRMQGGHPALGFMVQGSMAAEGPPCWPGSCGLNVYRSKEGLWDTPSGLRLSPTCLTSPQVKP